MVLLTGTGGKIPDDDDRQPNSLLRRQQPSFWRVLGDNYYRDVRDLWKHNKCKAFLALLLILFSLILLGRLWIPNLPLLLILFSLVLLGRICIPNLPLLLLILFPLILLSAILTILAQVVEARSRLCLCFLSDHLLRSPWYYFSYDEMHMVFVHIIEEKRVIAIFIAVVVEMVLLSFKIYFIRTGQNEGVLPAFVTLWISTVNLLLIDQLLSFCNKNCYNPFSKVPIHLLSLSIDICLTILLLPLHMPELAPIQVVPIENMVKKMMAMSFAVITFGYIMIILLVMGSYRA